MRDRERIAKEMADPALVRLHRKLERLSSVLTVMNTGAHPDDEASGMLAALRFGFGMRIVIACSTRGEGGQNALGSERGAALGVLRTREMEEAARVLDADISWLGHGPDDPVHDFGFSKNGDDSLVRWGEERIVERLVRAYREERPDIIIPTFLDVPGQHGHHRAMTRAAEIAVARGADASAYPEHFAEGLKPWEISKFYLPAWPGSGSTYDDERPPPPTTLVVHTPGDDTATGVPFARIGEWSRSAHASQGMGVWQENPVRSWPLHLLLKNDGETGHETDIRDGLLATIGSLAHDLSGEAARCLTAAQQAIEEAQDAFPHKTRILKAAITAATALNDAIAQCPSHTLSRIEHRLVRKLRELDALILEASGVHPRSWVEPSIVRPGGRSVLHVTVPKLDAMATVKPLVSPSIVATARGEDRDIRFFDLEIAADAPFTNSYPANFRALGPNGEVAASVEIDIGGYKARTVVDLEEPLYLMPRSTLTIEPDAVVINLAGTLPPFVVKACVRGGDEASDISLVAPDGWFVTSDGGDIRVNPPAHLKPGRYPLDGFIGGQPAFRSMPIAYPHIGRTAHLAREALHVLAVDVICPSQTIVGYAGGGNDRVGAWLERIGVDVTNMGRSELEGDLSRFTTIVVGISAFNSRPDLAAASERLHRFVEAGGHLVTLYHKPTDGWDPTSTPPRRIEIGSPSLRWRVTDPAAPVTILRPEHPLLTGPNRIKPEDWAGWDKERGLYFASSWDGSYEPLLAISDQGEKPLLGGLLSGQIGRGRHTHVSLVLHHQLEKLVPGAFRLIANLVQAACGSARVSFDHRLGTSGGGVG